MMGYFKLVYVRLNECLAGLENRPQKFGGRRIAIVKIRRNRLFRILPLIRIIFRDMQYCGEAIPESISIRKKILQFYFSLSTAMSFRNRGTSKGLGESIHEKKYFLYEGGLTLCLETLPAAKNLFYHMKC